MLSLHLKGRHDRFRRVDALWMLQWQDGVRFFDPFVDPVDLRRPKRPRRKYLFLLHF